MKKYIYLISVLLLTTFVASCDDMYDVHQKYLDEGEEVYIGYPNIVAAHGGYNRVQLVWKINSDPKIDACCIYWNNRKDSLVVPPDRSDTIMTRIIPLPEGKYQLEMINRSNKGYASLSQVVSAESYGEGYRDRLHNRIITNMLATPEDVTLTWSLEEGCVGVNFSYLNNVGEEKLIFFKGEETSLEVKDFTLGGTFSYSSLFVPEKNALDTISAVDITGNFPTYYVLSKEKWESDYHSNFVDLDRSGWSITASTEELSGEGTINGRINTLLDGDLATFWHTQWQGTAPRLPHQIDIDMKESKIISSIELARRNNNKDTKKVEFSISPDGQQWNPVGILSYPNAPSPNSRVLLFPNTVKGQYLRLMVVESNNAPHASLSEILLTTSK